jgi:hypothetical protein
MRSFPQELPALLKIEFFDEGKGTKVVVTQEDPRSERPDRVARNDGIVPEAGRIAGSALQPLIFPHGIDEERRA